MTVPMMFSIIKLLALVLMSVLSFIVLEFFVKFLFSYFYDTKTTERICNEVITITLICAGCILIILILLSMIYLWKTTSIF